jgi:hypothetical protein
MKRWGLLDGMEGDLLLRPRNKNAQKREPKNEDPGTKRPLALEGKSLQALLPVT